MDGVGFSGQADEILRPTTGGVVGYNDKLAMLLMNRALIALVAATLSLAVVRPAVAAQPVTGPAADWLKLKREADTAYAANNYGVAERGYLQALKQAESFGPNDLRVAENLHALVALYSTRGQFAKAEPLFERELRVKEKALGGEHPDVVATVGRLATFYMERGATAKADRLAHLLMTFAEKKVKEQQSIKDNFTKLSKYYDKSRDFSEAQSLLRKLQETTDKITANQDLELSTTLDALAKLYQTKNKYDVAERMFKSALAMRERTLSPSHLALAYSYENLASLYAAQGKQDQAQEFYKQSLEVTEKTLQPGRPEFFSRLDQLARTHETLGHYAEAESLYTRALALIDKSSPNSYDAGRAAYALAVLYCKDGKYIQAEPLMKRALKSSEIANGPQHAANAGILDSYADVLDKLNKSGEATKLRARAKAIRGTAVVQSGSDF